MKNAGWSVFGLSLTSVRLTTALVDGSIRSSRWSLVPTQTDPPPTAIGKAGALPVSIRAAILFVRGSMRRTPLEQPSANHTTA